MAFDNVMFDNYEDLIAHYKDVQLPYFTITHKTDVVLKNVHEDNLDAGAEMIYSFFNKLRKDNNAIYKINCYNKPNSSRAKKDEIDSISFTFRKPASPERETYIANKSEYSVGMHEKLDRMYEKLMELEMKQRLAEQSSDEDDLENEMQPQSTLGAIIGNPQVQQMLINVISNIFTNSMQSNKPNMNTYHKPMALAGTETISLEQILETLFANGVTIEDLHKLASMPKDKISFLLSMLRNG
jgi:hypothetical protein